MKILVSPFMLAEVNLPMFFFLSVFLLVDIKMLWRTIFLLERGKANNPQISLLLMKCYGMLGASESITDLFEAVSIKHLQMETIGYVWDT